MYRGLVVLVVAFSVSAATASAQGRGGGRGGGAAAEAPRVLGPAPPSRCSARRDSGRATC